MAVRLSPRGLRPLCLAVLIAGALSGCAVIDGLQKDRSGASPPETGDVSIAPPPPPKKPETEPQTAKAAPAPLPKRKPDMLDPKTLVGLDQTAIAELLGTPDSIVQGQPAQIWSWNAEGCEMKLFLYPDVANKTFKALTYEINASDNRHKAVTVDTCASRLKWAHAEESR